MFVVTPRLAPAYQAPQCNPLGFCAPVSRPAYSHRVARPQPRRPRYSPFNNFFSQVDELLGEIDREAQRQAQREAHLEAQREAHRLKQQQRERAMRTNFAIKQDEHGWQIDGDIQGFEPGQINVEVTDEHTLKITGNTRWQSEKTQAEPEHPGTQAPATEDTSEHTEPEPQPQTIAESATNSSRPASPDSDAESHKSYQPTVEDDFEDLGAETSSLISASSGSSSRETPSGKQPSSENNAEENAPAPTPVVALQSQPEQVAQNPQSKDQDRTHGTFERTFRFPTKIDIANITASFKDNVLKIQVPRAPVVQVKRIAIQ